jgi:hypothetical protein
MNIEFCKFMFTRSQASIKDLSMVFMFFSMAAISPGNALYSTRLIGRN